MAGTGARAAGAGPSRKLVFVDRLLVTLVHLRLGLSHPAFAELWGVDRPTVSGAIREVRPLPASRGFAVPERPGVRLRTREDVFAYAEAEGVSLRIDGTEVQVRRRAQAARVARRSCPARRIRIHAQPCEVHPEQITEHEYLGLLPEALCIHTCPADPFPPHLLSLQ